MRCGKLKDEDREQCSRIADRLVNDYSELFNLWCTNQPNLTHEIDAAVNDDSISQCLAIDDFEHGVALHEPTAMTEKKVLLLALTSDGESNRTKLVKDALRAYLRSPDERVHSN